jgi:hypothetical protein
VTVGPWSISFRPLHSITFCARSRKLTEFSAVAAETRKIRMKIEGGRQAPFDRTKLTAAYDCRCFWSDLLVESGRGRLSRITCHRTGSDGSIGAKSKLGDQRSRYDPADDRLSTMYTKRRCCLCRSRSWLRQAGRERDHRLGGIPGTSRDHGGARAKESGALLPETRFGLSSPDQPTQGSPHRKANGERQHPGPRR